MIKLSINLQSTGSIRKAVIGEDIIFIFNVTTEKIIFIIFTTAGISICQYHIFPIDDSCFPGIEDGIYAAIVLSVNGNVIPYVQAVVIFLIRAVLQGNLKLAMGFPSAVHSDGDEACIYLDRAYRIGNGNFGCCMIFAIFSYRFQTNLLTGFQRGSDAEFFAFCYFREVIERCIGIIDHIQTANRFEWGKFFRLFDKLPVDI